MCTCQQCLIDLGDRAHQQDIGICYGGRIQMTTINGHYLPQLGKQGQHIGIFSSTTNFIDFPALLWIKPLFYQRPADLSESGAHLRKVLTSSASAHKQRRKPFGFLLVSLHQGAYLYLRITSVALVPPKPKLLLITVLSSASRYSRTIGIPSAAESRLSILMEGAIKPPSSINRLYIAS